MGGGQLPQPFVKHTVSHGNDGQALHSLCSPMEAQNLMEYVSRGSIVIVPTLRRQQLSHHGRTGRVKDMAAYESRSSRRLLLRRRHRTRMRCASLPRGPIDHQNGGQWPLDHLCRYSVSKCRFHGHTRFHAGAGAVLAPTRGACTQQLRSSNISSNQMKHRHGGSGGMFHVSKMIESTH